MKYIFLIIILFSGYFLFAQDIRADLHNPDSLFEQARIFNQEGNSGEAIHICTRILKEYPDYHDIVIYLAQLYGREGRYSDGIEILGPVLKIEPPIKEAYTALTRIYFWGNLWQDLYNATIEALKKYPSDTEFQYMNALALYHLDRSKDAMDALEAILEEYPDHTRALQLKRLVYEEGNFMELFFSYNFDYFKQPYERNWHQLTAGAVLPFNKIKLLPSVSGGHAFDSETPFLNTSALQFNLDGYIDISESNYALLGYGIGSGTYLPRHRGIFHFWQKLPASWTVSAGARYFYFDQHFLFYAFGIEKYAGNYWVELKNYLFRKEYGLSSAFFLTSRRYFSSSRHYLGMMAGYGTSPDEPVAIMSDFQRLNALTFRINYSMHLGNRSVGEIGAGYLYDEYSEEIYRNRFNGYLKYAIKLK